jgi:hypothetical protein
MSDETSDREPTDPTPRKGADTVPILERLYDELRALRETATRIETKVDSLEARFGVLETRFDALSESTRDSAERVERLVFDQRTEFRRSAVMDSELVNIRIERLEKELRVLREQQQ